MAVYENYGDANFFEGGMFIRDEGDGCFDVITCDFINDCEDDKCYLVEDGAVDITDNWIDMNAVMRSFDLIEDEVEDVIIARAVIDYYGLEQCGSTRSYKMASDEVVKFMDEYAENNEFDENTWSEGPLY